MRWSMFRHWFREPALTLMTSALLVTCSGNNYEEHLHGLRDGLDTNSVNIDLEGSSVVIQEFAPPTSPHKLFDDGKWFPFALEGSSLDPWYYEANKPYISSGLHFGSAATGHSVQLTLPPRSGSTGPDRAEMFAYGWGFEDDYGVAFDFNRPRYLGFAMYIHESSAVPLLSDVTFMQAWQFGVGRDASGGNCGVPLHATLLKGSGSPLQFKVFAHDNAAPGYGEHQVVPATTISRGVWHTFVFYLAPNSNADVNHSGLVKLWFDASVVGPPTFQWSGDWGCNLGPNPPYGTVEDKWHIRVGMYRTGSGVLDQWMYTFFDNVRVATTASSARPMY